LPVAVAALLVAPPAVGVGLVEQVDFYLLIILFFPLEHIQLL
jgi:hypothetical protein